MYYDMEKKQWFERGQELSDPAPTPAPPPAPAPVARGCLAPPPMAQHAELAMCEAERKSSLAPTGPSRMKQLERLLCLAAANGSFRPGAESIVGLKDELICAWAAEFGTSEDVLLTALVLAYLRQEFPKEKDTWILVARKSMVWLENREHAWKTEAIADVEALISKAAGKL